MWVFSSNKRIIVLSFRIHKLHLFMKVKKLLYFSQFNIYKWTIVFFKISLMPSVIIYGQCTCDGRGV
jgi:hypothetical protein